MDLLQAMRERHSVRAYTDRPIEGETLAALNDMIEACNRESGLHIQLVLNEAKAFGGFMARYGKFSGVRNYVVLIGKKEDGVQEKIGYFGEKFALYAQTLGLNTCWVALTYKKVSGVYRIDRGEKLCCVLAVGYGATQGTPHKSKTPEEVCSGSVQETWFLDGVRAALLAPTAMNQQKFHFTLLSDHTVEISAKSGFYTQMDLGIVKYHFELGAGDAKFQWAKR